MDFLREEISRKRKVVEGNGLVTDKRKYFKRSQYDALEAAAAAAAAAEEEEEEAAAEATGGGGGGATATVIVHSFSSTDVGVQQQSSSDDTTAPQEDISPTEGSVASLVKRGLRLPESEIIKRLRARKEPVRLFGESDDERIGRLRQLEIIMPEVNVGLRNELMEARNAIEKEFLDSAVRGEDEEALEKERKQLEADREVMKYSLEDLKAMTGSGIEGDDATKQEVVRSFLKILLRLWKAKLREVHDMEGARNQKTTLALATLRQTEVYIAPLFKKLKKGNQLPQDVVAFLAEIVSNMMDREYVKANDSYLRMAIGNAAWPIGATMVGIHERSAREKIFAKNVAHVMNDEESRKYIQGLKRLMSFCQRIFPTDPSRSVEYEPQDKIEF